MLHRVSLALCSLSVERVPLQPAALFSASATGADVTPCNLCSRYRYLVSPIVTGTPRAVTLPFVRGVLGYVKIIAPPAPVGRGIFLPGLTCLKLEG